MKNKFIILLFLSLFIGLLYISLVSGNSASNLMETKQMVPLSASETELKLSLVPSRYLLKLKYRFTEAQSAEVFFNDEPLSLSKARKKKVIETDYFYIQPGQIRKDNALKVKFGVHFPADIDVRLSNFVIFPFENLSYDVFILFKNNSARAIFPVINWLLNSLLFLFFLISVYAFLKNRSKRPVFHIRMALFPFTAFSAILMLNNCISLSPYQVSVTPFFFLLLFSLSFFMMLIFILSRSENRTLKGADE